MSRAAKSFSHIIFDLDGVLYRGHTPISGAAGALEQIRAAGLSVSFITNNATRSRKQIQIRLAKMGIPVRMDELMTSAYATGRYLQTLKPKPHSLYVLGERGLRSELASAGFSLKPCRLPGERHASTTFSHLPHGESAPCADVLVSGLDRHATYAKLAAALDVLNSGAKWVACNLDPTLPMENGAHPGSGSIGACLAYGAGRVKGAGCAKREKRTAGAAFSNIVLREPDIVVGKPNTYMLDILCKGCTKSKRSSILFVGDRLDMDIAFANSAGLSSVLVLTGVTKLKDGKQARGLLKPGAILPSVSSLPKWLGI